MVHCLLNGKVMCGIPKKKGLKLLGWMRFSEYSINGTDYCRLCMERVREYAAGGGDDAFSGGRDE